MDDQQTTEHPGPAMFRLRYGWRKGNVSSSEVEYHEGAHSLAESLYRHTLDVRSEATARWRHDDRDGRLRHLLLRLFRDDAAPDKVENRTTTEIIAVERWTENGWVHVDATMSDPSVTVDGIVYPRE